ncbi:hypothetical protein [Streptomyces sp. NPDC059003]|uniref:competence protein CoiA family protein n=1 Tax=Streptomyces sp. NPDC059003 TaxID=3346691 RepID=UPI0036927A02
MPAISPTGEQRTAWEAQLSPITEDDLRERTRRYAASGIGVCWVTPRDRVPWLGTSPERRGEAWTVADGIARFDEKRGSWVRHEDMRQRQDVLKRERLEREAAAEQRRQEREKARQEEAARSRAIKEEAAREAAQARRAQQAAAAEKRHQELLRQWGGRNASARKQNGSEGPRRPGWLPSDAGRKNAWSSRRRGRGGARCPRTSSRTSLTR